MYIIPIVALLFLTSSPDKNFFDKIVNSTLAFQEVLDDANATGEIINILGNVGNKMGMSSTQRAITDIVNTTIQEYDRKDGSRGVIVDGMGTVPVQPNDLSITEIKIPYKHTLKDDKTQGPTNFKYPDGNPHSIALDGKKIITEKVFEEKKGKLPVEATPLFIFRNKCPVGYIFDENNICQKLIKGKEKDLSDFEDRRKREVPKPIRMKRVLEEMAPPKESFYPTEKGDCSEIYPGLVSDGAGGCIKQMFESFV